jgi:glucose-6-phosphate 1-dehydrogenase
MEAPSSTYAEAIRDEQAKVLRTIRPLSAAKITRGQFRGYRNEPGVNPNSPIATYAALRLDVHSWRWDGVPFYVRAGKCLKTTTTEVFVELKVPPQVVFTEAKPSLGNYLRFRLNPQVAIALGARAKRPGEGMTGQPIELSLVEQPVETRLGDYERLLSDAIKGDATLFARQDVVEAAWAIVNPLLKDPGELFEYEPGSWGPPQADALVAEVGGWNTPQ